MKNPQGGIYYEINRDYPMIKQIVDNDPALKSALISVFQQIERGLPLNQLYVDLINDEQLVNDQDQPAPDITAALSAMLEGCNNNTEKLAILDTMSSIEPFASYPEVLDSLRKEITNG